MALFFTPSIGPVYQQQCGPFTHRPARPTPRPSRAVASSSIPFFTQVGDLLNEVNREAQRKEQREAYSLRQLRKRVFRAKFDVHEGREAYQVDGEVPGFEQENISIEVSDEHTLKVSGHNASEAEKPQRQWEPMTSNAEQHAIAAEPRLDGLTLNEPDTIHSDTESNRSYQATVEDDFEDLGETRSTSSRDSQIAETKSKAKTDNDAAAESNIDVQQPLASQSSKPQAEYREWLSERQVGSFERTFRFPERIDGSIVRASLRNGVLSITIPKAPIPEVRRIAIL